MEIKEEFNSVFRKFDIIKDDLKPVLILNEFERKIIQENNDIFIRNILIQYGSSDIKKFFILLPEMLLNISRGQVIEIFNYIDSIPNAYEAFYGVFIFLYDIIKLDMKKLLTEELDFTHLSIIKFIEQKEEYLGTPSKVLSIDLKYININMDMVEEIRQKIMGSFN